MGFHYVSEISCECATLYRDDLSDRLNAVQAGCFFGNKRINHLMYADDLCCFAPSFDGLQDLVNILYV